MCTLSIRPSTAADVEGMLEVARALPQWFTELGVQQMTADFSTHAGVVAVDGGGKVLGFVTWAPFREEEGVMDITWLGVAPELRGQGGGRRLCEAAEAGARAAGCHAIVVSTLADTCDYEPYAQTRAFYHAVGLADFRVDKACDPTPTSINFTERSKRRRRPTPRAFGWSARRPFDPLRAGDAKRFII